MATIEELRSEVERLTRELDLQSSEISQSAKYGLGLLEEKLALQTKCEELENLYENNKHELDITLEVSLQIKTQDSFEIAYDSNQEFYIVPLSFDIFAFNKKLVFGFQ